LIRQWQIFATQIDSLVTLCNNSSWFSCDKS